MPRLSKSIQPMPKPVESAPINWSKSARLGPVVLQEDVTAVAPGVRFTQGSRLASSTSGQTVNALIDADMKTDIVDGACYNETFVTLTPAG